MESFFRNKIEEILIFSSWSERFRSDIGFNGVSQIWSDRPAWYFWLTDSPGVYRLEMMDTEGDADIGQDRYTAVFKVKCYPYQDRPEFQSFSFIERKLVQSRLFDDTNTPVFEHQGNIPDDLFTVAVIEITMSPEGRGAIFSFESMGYLRTRFADKTHKTFPVLNLSRTFGIKEIDRNVPGFQMGYPLFDCLMCLYANAHKQPPAHIRFSTFSGYEFAIDGDDVHARKTSTIKGFRLNIFFSAADSESCPDGNRVLRNSPEEGENTIYNRHFGCKNFKINQLDKRLPVILNQKWWSLAHTHYESELTSSCGCH